MTKIARCVVLVSLVVCVATIGSAQPNSAKTMSLEDRFLFNRIVLRGEKRIQIMVLCDPNKINLLMQSLQRLDGAIKFIDRKVGYLRVDLPTANFARLVTSTLVDGFHIATMAKSSLFRDSLPRQQYEGYFSVTNQPGPPIAPPESTPDPKLPVLDHDTSLQAGYTADEDMHIDDWLRTHPTYDGRGVTVAFEEGGQVDFTHPTIGTAKTLDGKPVDKIAAIIDAMDQSDPAYLDSSRVVLSTVIDAKSTWIQLANRTYILPRPGKYRFGYWFLGAGGNLTQQFGVLKSETTGEIWVDTDANGNFSDEKSVVGVEKKFEIRSFKNIQPAKTDLTFVVANASSPDVVNIYYSAGSHNSMTLSVAVGNKNSDVAYGVAPAARALLVRGWWRSPLLRLSDFIEATLVAAARPEVDVITSSFATEFVPGTDADFTGLLFHRLVRTYNKPVFISAGNARQELKTAGAFGDAFVVGGSISPSTFKAFYGGWELPETILHPYSAAGPSRDGRLKPDFLAPEERVAASTCFSEAGSPIPRNQPTKRLPPCYWISGNTSASSPYAAGVAALLISAAKQAHVDYSVESLRRALQASARFLPNTPAYKQGGGLIDVEGAWRELQKNVLDPRITITGENHQVVTPYSQGGENGPGLFEEEGWSVGAAGTRTFRIRRQAGPVAPTPYKLDWTGNDGTFSAPSSIVLPLNRIVSLPVVVNPKSTGIHSAVLNVYEASTGAMVQRALATIIVPERFTSPTYKAIFNGTVPVMREKSEFWEVPAHTNTIELELTIKRGTANAPIVQSIDKRYSHLFPGSLWRALIPGTYHFTIPTPTSGVWSITIANTSIYDANWSATSANSSESQKPTPRSTTDVEYSLTVRALGAELNNSSREQDKLSISNRGDMIKQPELKESTGILTSYRGNFDPSGEQHPFEINVPTGAAALIVTAAMERERRANGNSSLNGLDLYVYDCTTGECFPEDFAIPANAEQRIVIRRPAAGRWIAMTGSPTFPGRGSFTIDAVVALEKGSHKINLDRAIAVGETRSISVTNGATGPPDDVRVFELFDTSLEKEEAEHSWTTEADRNKLTNRPATLGIAITNNKTRDASARIN